jgi:hypothetical protein
MTEPSDLVYSPSRAEREQMVAVAAYYLAERRGFAPGSELADWQRAERQIDRMLTAMAQRGIDRRQFERAGLRNALHLWAGAQTAEVV